MMNKHDIKRVLGVGTATMSEHLRQYKDPFEPREPELTLEPLEPKHFAPCRPGSQARDNTVSRNSRSSTLKS